MTNRIRGALPVALAIAAVAAPTAGAAPVSVNLRVEGATSTIFEGPVTTDGHTITTASSGGPQPCDGTNAGAFPSPVPTATAALDDGARLNGFTWDADWFSSFSDFSVKQRRPRTRPRSTQFWGLAVNFQFSQTGGCSQRRSTTATRCCGSSTPSASSTSSSSPGPTTATTGTPVSVRVTRRPGRLARGGRDRQRRDHRRRRHGPRCRFANAGDLQAQGRARRLGALERAHAVRGPARRRSLHARRRRRPERRSESCPDRLLASERGRSRTMLISWQASDSPAPACRYYEVDVRELADGVKASQRGGRLDASSSAPTGPASTSAATPGSAYQFRITAVDRAANRTTIETDPLVLPVDDRDRGLWKLSQRLEAHRSSSAWGRTVVRAAEAGATATLRFTGRSVSLIGRKLAQGRAPAGHARRQAADAAPARPLRPAQRAVDELAAARRRARRCALRVAGRRAGRARRGGAACREAGRC